MQVKTQQLELDIEQQTGTKSGKGHIKAICFHPVYLICVSCEMQSISCEYVMKYRVYHVKCQAV